MSDALDNDPIGQAIAQLEANIVKMQSAIETLRGIRPMVGVNGGTTDSGGKEASFKHDSFFGMTAADAAKKYLAAVKKTASPKTIADAMVAGGWKSASKNVSENVRTILNRNPAFVVINGEFGLAEWYPGRKSVNKTRTATTPVVSDEPTPTAEEAPFVEPHANMEEGETADGV